MYLSSSVGKDLAQEGVLAHNSSNREASETPSRDTPPRDKLIRAATELPGMFTCIRFHLRVGQAENLPEVMNNESVESPDVKNPPS